MPDAPVGLRRYPRTRRTAIIAAITLTLLLILRMIWGQLASHRLNEKLAAAKGEPLTIEQLYPSDLPYDAPDNALPLLYEAMAEVGKVENAGVWTPAQSNLSYPEYPPFTPAWHQYADAAVPANAPAYALARQARSRPSFRWQINRKRPLFQNISAGGSLNQARDLANVLGDGALHAHLRGDDVEALERIEDLRHLVHAFDQPPALVHYLVGIGIDSLALNRLEVIAPGLTIKSHDESDPIRQRARKLITELTADAGQSESLRRALLAERVYQIDLFSWTAEHCWVVRPMYELELTRMLEFDEVMLKAAAEPTVPGSRRLIDPFLADHPPTYATFSRTSTPPPTPPRFTRELSSSFSGGMGRLVEVGMRVRLERSLAAVSLAAQLYRADHDGAWPASLDALVPQYLPAVPRDPYADDQPLRYRLIRHGLPDGRDRPMVYSIGPDGVDDSVKVNASLLPPEPQYDWNNHGAKEKGDQLRDLSRFVPPTPATAPATNPDGSQ